MSGSSPPVEWRKLDELQPSQLLVSDEKLRGVVDWWDVEDPDPDPIPYLKPVDDLGLDPGVVDPGRVVLADGHTRTLTAVLSGAESLPVVRDPDREELSMETYRVCVGWCLDGDVRTPGDLVGRVVGHERFLEEWVARCQAVREGD